MFEKGYVLITGASSGIGADLAREYAKRGKPLVLTARREDRLQALAEELRKQVDCVVIAMDLAQPGSPQALFEQTQQRGLFVETLVNNAGLGISGRYLSVPMKTHSDFVQLMITTIAELTYLYLPAMEQRGRGRILNIASLAGLVPASAGHTLYGATKAWLIRFSECLAMEESDKGIHVTALCPGFTYTEFHDVNGMRDRVSQLPKFLWLSSTEVARLGVDAVESGKRVLVTGKTNKLIAMISKYMPGWLARVLIDRNSKNFRNAD
jgi:uncharacterized protein